MKTTREDLLGAIQPPTDHKPEKMDPFNPKEVMETIQGNPDRLLVPYYCSHCGSTLYVDFKNVYVLLEEGDEYPVYEVGVYFEVDGCPECRGLTKSIIKRFEVA